MNKKERRVYNHTYYLDHVKPKLKETGISHDIFSCPMCGLVSDIRRFDSGCYGLLTFKKFGSRFEPCVMDELTLKRFRTSCGIKMLDFIKNNFHTDLQLPTSQNDSSLVGAGHVIQSNAGSGHLENPNFGLGAIVTTSFRGSGSPKVFSGAGDIA